MIPSSAVEIIEKRTIRSKTYFLEDNKFIVSSSPMPVHFWNGTQYQEINPSWDNDSTGHAVSSGVGFSVETNFQNKAFSWGFNGSDNSRIDGNLSLINGQILNSIPNLSIGPPIISGTEILWENVMPNTDILAILSWGGVSWNWVMKQASSPRNVDWEIVEDISGYSKLDLNIRGRDNLRRNPGRNVESSRKIEVITPILQTPIDEVTHPGRRSYRIKSGWTGRVQEIDPNTRIRSWGNRPIYPVRLDPTVTEDIASDADDGFESASIWQPGYSYVYMGRAGANIFHGGLRFQTIDVPNGASITSAQITIDIIGGFSPVSLTVYGDDTDSAPVFSDASLPSGVVKTTANTVINPPTTAGLYSFDVTAIVQEIVDRAGWAANNNMRFSILTEGAYASGYHNVQFVDLSTWGDPDVAQLEIIYEVGAGGATNVSSLRPNLRKYNHLLAR